MNKFMRMLLLLSLLSLSSGSLLAREQGQAKPVVGTHVVSPGTAQGFSGDGTQWWVIEQIVQQIKEFVSSHLSNQP